MSDTVRYDQIAQGGFFRFPTGGKDPGYDCVWCCVNGIDESDTRTIAWPVDGDCPAWFNHDEQVIPLVAIWLEEDEECRIWKKKAKDVKQFGCLEVGQRFRHKGGEYFKIHVIRHPVMGGINVVCLRGGIDHSMGESDGFADTLQVEASE